jgi:hypothetical protein
MAKDLPYFKFFVSEWNDGDITLEDYKIQGLFINVCAYYWSRECDLDYTTLLKKFKHNVNDINVIIESDLIKIDGDKISINFLDEQFNERGKLSNQNSINAKKRWKNSDRNATASNPQCENHAIKRREEKKREEKKREENKPSKELFISHALSKKSNLDIESISLKYDAWIENGWKDGNDKPIKNWKSKLTNTIPYLKAIETPKYSGPSSKPLN